MQEKSISLYFTDASSDKEYHCDLKASGDGFVVDFRYGRRGTALQSGTKTNAPLPYDKALNVYSKLVAEKTGKGYTTGESGAAYQDGPKSADFTGILPQLPNSIEDGEVATYLNDDLYGMQEKMDGKRRPVRVADGATTGINKKGLRVALPVALATLAQRAAGESALTLDGEVIGETLYVFDLLELGRDLRKKGFSERLAALTGLATQQGWTGQTDIRLVPCYTGFEAKYAAYKRLEAAGAEGVVFKRLDAPYVPGQPASGGSQLKKKFLESATVLCTAVSPTKRSVTMGLRDAGGDVVVVGNVTIPPNRAIPKEGAIFDVRYLYAFPGGSLFQPVFLEERDDQDATSCVLSQLKFKAGAAATAE